MNFLEELRWRGLLQDSTPGLEEALRDKMITAYVGFDPTAASLTIGNYVAIMVLKLFQLCGHKPIVLMGGATGRVGDPSGKDKERELKSYEELDSNLEFQKAQFKKLLDFENGENKAEFANNLDFYKEMNVLDFLRDVGKTLTVNYMMSKESVQKRLETGISFTEFSYQLLQAYDFQVLFKTKNCILQMGGSDQWGNITSGTEFIRKNLDGKAYALTVPLLTKADGKKFGKSEEGNIWLDANLTSPYQFYQFWINCDDADLKKFYRCFSLHSKEEVESLEAQFAADPRERKRLLAEELTIRIHSVEAFQSVVKVSDLLFGKNATKETLLELNEMELEMVASEIPTFTIAKDSITNGINILDLLSEQTQIVNSKSEARRAIQGNAVAINKERMNNQDAVLNQEILLRNKYLMIENGKKNKYLVIVQ